MIWLPWNQRRRNGSESGNNNQRCVTRVCWWVERRQASAHSAIWLGRLKNLRSPRSIIRMLSGSKYWHTICIWTKDREFLGFRVRSPWPTHCAQLNCNGTVWWCPALQNGSDERRKRLLVNQQNNFAEHTSCCHISMILSIIHFQIRFSPKISEAASAWNVLSLSAREFDII